MKSKIRNTIFNGKNLFIILLALFSIIGGIHKILTSNQLDAFLKVGLGPTFGVVFGSIQVIASFLLFKHETKKASVILLSLMLIFTIVVLAI